MDRALSAIPMKRVLLNSSLCSGEVPKALKRYLRERVTPLHIHRFDPGDVQFADALVSSAVVWFRNIPPPLDQSVMFSFRGSLLEPKLSRAVPLKVLAEEPKWTRFPAAEIRGRSTVPTIADFSGSQLTQELSQLRGSVVTQLGFLGREFGSRRLGE